MFLRFSKKTLGLVVIAFLNSGAAYSGCPGGPGKVQNALNFLNEYKKKAGSDTRCKDAISGAESQLQRIKDQFALGQCRLASANAANFVTYINGWNQAYKPLAAGSTTKECGKP